MDKKAKHVDLTKLETHEAVSIGTVYVLAFFAGAFMGINLFY